MKSPKQQVIERLHKIEGQIHGLQKMVEKEKSCFELLKQISAVQGALRSLSQFILKEHMNICIHNVKSNNPQLKELSENILKLFVQLYRQK